MKVVPLDFTQVAKRPGANGRHQDIILGPGRLLRRSVFPTGTQDTPAMRHDSHQSHQITFVMRGEATFRFLDTMEPVKCTPLGEDGVMCGVFIPSGRDHVTDYAPGTETINIYIVPAPEEEQEHWLAKVTEVLATGGMSLVLKPRTKEPFKQTRQQK